MLTAIRPCTYTNIDLSLHISHMPGDHMPFVMVNLKVYTHRVLNCLQILTYLRLVDYFIFERGLIRYLLFFCFFVCVCVCVFFPLVASQFCGGSNSAARRDKVRSNTRISLRIHTLWIDEDP